MTERVYQWSEIFGKTIQGEGCYTGVCTVWLRWWGCNFTCMGFGQSHLPRDQWVDPYADIDVSKYNSMEELPVFPLGCDSGYSWSKKFRHLAKRGNAKQIADEIRNLLVGGTFAHPKSRQPVHMAFTGGESMMSQSGTVAVMEEFLKGPDSPKFVTMETNGTQQIRENFRQFFGSHDKFAGELFWSISPKLSTSGEDWNRAIRPEVVKTYSELSNAGQLKFVSDGSANNWDEVERATELYRNVGVEFPVWIMPVGGTKEEQEDIQALVAEGAIERGYNVAARVHCWLFGNVVGK